MNRFLQTIYRSIQINKRKHIKTSQIFQILLKGATGEFRKNTPLNNFSTMRPIFTDSILIDSTPLAEHNKKHQNYQHSILATVNFQTAYFSVDQFFGSRQTFLVD
jgi:hypothetical protein